MCNSPFLDELKARVNEDTLLPMIFLGLRKLGNMCCGQKMFLNKIGNILCVPLRKFVSATNVARAGKLGKHLCRQQCVRNNVSSFARALIKNGFTGPGPVLEKRATGLLGVAFNP